ncbi:response regulator [Desulfobulbus oralis]|uniref:Response regulator n=1 Tax=Desulfobulbus oralis TaxID=1986146 RepID=A0A2L1GPU6_9BACT|nr:response regulator [Desulfobulbus oralis]AVD71644.1 response regulator [Desulfobulbus oralis]
MAEAIRVLIVDDEEDFRETIIKRLKVRKLEACGAGTGTAALDLLREKEFDVMVLDVKMPDMNGVDTLKAAKQIAPNVEVIMLTGHASMEFGMKGMQLGAFDYIMKPVPINELLDTITQAYNKKQGLA